MEFKDVIVVGSGNAALCAGIAALEKGASVLMLEKADKELAGGNSKYTAGAMRFVYNSNEDLYPLLLNPDDERLAITEFGSYSREKFNEDLLKFNDGRALSEEQKLLIDESYGTMLWLAQKGVKFEPIYDRQSFFENGKHVFWGGLTLAAEGEGVGLVQSELDVFLAMGGEIRYECEVNDLLVKADQICGVKFKNADNNNEEIEAKSVILACGGFEANAEMRKHYIGEDWEGAKVRGTPHNMGQGLQLAFKYGACEYGFYKGCHATPMDLHMKDFGNLELPHIERKHYRKICYFLGIMLNANGERFVDEGKDFRNYTYAQFGGEILKQPGHFAWQIFDHKVDDLLYSEYRFKDAHFVEANSLEALVEKLDGIDDKANALNNIHAFNKAVDEKTPFNPSIKDGKATIGLSLAKSNWAQKIDKPPFKAYPVTGGITFTYGGVKINGKGEVLRENGTPILGLYACGEMVGGVFYNGYPGGSGLTSGAVFGRRAGTGAAEFA